MKHISLRRLLETSMQEGAEEEQEVRDILKQDYESFVSKLGDNINDPKFRQAIKIAASDNPIQTTDMSPAVTELLPTQNEIDVDKSLKYPLTNAGSADQLLKGGTITIVSPIITGGDGKFIIDGHHRWSQSYVINPAVKIAALDINNIDKPIEGLKATQLGIAADIGKVPTQSVQGSNLLVMGESELKKYVISTITDPVLEVFKKYGKGDTPEAVADYIWGNVKMMQSNNTPVPGAPARNVMPQTDTSSNWKDNAPALTAEQKRWRHIAGL